MSCWIYFRMHENIGSFSVLSQHRKGSFSWNHASCKTRTCSTCKVNNMFMGRQVMQEPWVIYTEGLLPILKGNFVTWWRHQMETFSTLLAICAGNSPITGEFPAQRPVPWNFDVFFDLRPNKRLSKQTWGLWFEMPPCPLCNEQCHPSVSLFIRVSALIIHT